MVLVRLVDQRKGIILGSFSGTGDGKFEKQAAWEEIQKEFQAATAVERSSDELKKKWNDLKMSAKKDVARFRKECAGTGGGPAPVPASEVHTKLVEVIGDEAVEGVIGGLDTSAVKRPTEKTQPLVMPPKKRIRQDKSQQQMGEMLATQQAILDTLSQMASEQTRTTVALERIAAALECRASLNFGHPSYAQL